MDTVTKFNFWIPCGGVYFSASERKILQRLLAGYVVGPEAHAVLDKLNDNENKPLQ